MEDQEDGVHKLFRIILDDWELDEQQKATMWDRYYDGADNTSGLFSVAASLDELYRDDDVVRKFLREPQELLGGKTPIESMLTDHPQKIVELVDYLSGR